MLKLSALWIPDAIRILNTTLISVYVHQDLLERGVKQVSAMRWAQPMAESFFPFILWFFRKNALLNLSLQFENEKGTRLEYYSIWKI